tara:strand:+ start:3285 stop:3488 length:204 start_codon:yes stop_codon:yes gene_type:complete
MANQNLYFSIKSLKDAYKKRIAENKFDYEHGFLSEKDMVEKNYLAKELFDASLSAMGVCPINMKTIK